MTFLPSGCAQVGFAPSPRQMVIDTAAFQPFCVCADTGDTDEFADKQQEKGPDNVFSEQFTATGSSAALEGSLSGRSVIVAVYAPWGLNVPG